MNGAHFHLLVNHFPLSTLLFGTILLAIGILAKSRQLQFTSFGFFIVTGITAILSNWSGEDAEHIVEELGISHDIIHEHEEMAETFFILCVILAILSIAQIFLLKKKKPVSNLLNIVLLLAGIGLSIIGGNVGNSGGEIRHTEIVDN